METEAPITSSTMNQTWGLPWLDSNASRPSLQYRSGKEKSGFLFEIGIENFITLIAFGLIFTLGVMGNSLVITVLARSKPGKPRSTTNIFVLNLSIADLAYLLFLWPDLQQKKVYVICTFIFGYLLPLLLISFCYAKDWREIMPMLLRLSAQFKKVPGVDRISFDC